MGLFSSKKAGQSYAVTTGVYAGQILIGVNKTESTYQFLSIPLMNNVDVPVDKFDAAITAGILEKMKNTIPANVVNLCIAQYKKNQSTK